MVRVNACPYNQKTVEQSKNNGQTITRLGLLWARRVCLTDTAGIEDTTQLKPEALI